MEVPVPSGEPDGLETDERRAIGRTEPEPVVDRRPPERRRSGDEREFGALRPATNVAGDAVVLVREVPGHLGRSDEGADELAPEKRRVRLDGSEDVCVHDVREPALAVGGRPSDPGVTGREIEHWAPERDEPDELPVVPVTDQEPEAAAEPPRDGDRPEPRGKPEDGGVLGPRGDGDQFGLDMGRTDFAPLGEVVNERRRVRSEECRLGPVPLRPVGEVERSDGVLVEDEAEPSGRVEPERAEVLQEGMPNSLRGCRDRHGRFEAALAWVHPGQAVAG